MIGLLLQLAAGFLIVTGIQALAIVAVGIPLLWHMRTRRGRMAGAGR